MKRTYLSALVALFFIVASSCSSPNKAMGPAGSNTDLKGTWTVNDVDFDGASKSSIKVTVFDDALVSCFVGSQWALIQNGNGTYTISSSDQSCNPGQRKIYWSIQNVNGVQYFQFKKLMEGDKPSKVVDGYRLQVKALQGNIMTLTSTAELDGKTIYINFHLTKQ